MLNSSITRTSFQKTDNSHQTLAVNKPRPDSRRLNQRRANRLAWLVVDGQVQGFHCTLRELSSDGAQITVAGLMGIPDRFSLYIEPDSLKYSCRVTARKGNSVRVDFVDCEENVRFRDLSARR